MRYALIENNIVKDIFVEPEGIDISECFHPDILPLYIPCPNENIVEGDLYDSDTQVFSEAPDKKYPTYVIWFNSLKNKQDQLNNYSLNINPVINGFEMSITKIDLYKQVLRDALLGVTDDVEIEGKIFSPDVFKSMIDALKTFNSQKQEIFSSHLNNINSFNHSIDIDTYDFTEGWPNTEVMI